MQYWLVKQEPEDFSWADLVKARRTDWTGVRSFQARNHLRSMKKGDLVWFYHSGSGKEVVGICRVAREAYPDPTASEGDWCSVDLVPVAPCERSLSLAAIKSDSVLKQMALVKQTRLSVLPVNQNQFERLLELTGTKLR